MKPKILLRIAALLMLLHTIGHTMGVLTWKKAPNTNIAQVITGMQNGHFQFMGREASLAAFYEGYGVSMIAVLLFVSMLLWILSSLPESRMIRLAGIFLLCLGILEYIYFFPFAAFFSVGAGICTLIVLNRPIKTAKTSFY